MSISANECRLMSPNAVGSVEKYAVNKKVLISSIILDYLNSEKKFQSDARMSRLVRANRLDRKPSTFNQSAGLSSLTNVLNRND